MKCFYLKKGGGSRFKDVDTYKVVCSKPSEYIEIARSLKSADAHVAIANLRSFKKQSVVKVLSSKNKHARKEIDILQRLKNFHHVVQYLCSFQCYDSKTRWMTPLETPTTACITSKKDKQKLTFIVMEYIENGDLVAFLQDPRRTANELLSFLLQSCLVIATLGYKYNISHGDLNSGNILVRKTNKETTYFIHSKRKTKIEIKTYGFMPVFLDFGESEFYHEGLVDKDEGIIEDIFQFLRTLSYWMHYSFQNKPSIFRPLHAKIHAYLDEAEKTTNISIDTVLDTLKNIFKSLGQPT